MPAREIAETETTYCEVADCQRPAVRSGLCERHRKRLRQGKGVGEPLDDRATPYERALAAATEHLDADLARRQEGRANGKDDDPHGLALAAWKGHLDAETDAEYHRTRVRLHKASRAWTWDLAQFTLPALHDEMNRIGAEVARRGKKPCARCAFHMTSLAAGRSEADQPRGCSFPGCERPRTEHALFCEGHRKQSQRGDALAPLEPRTRVGEKSPYECFFDALERHAYSDDSDTDRGYARTRAILWYHARRWVLSGQDGPTCAEACPVAVELKRELRRLRREARTSREEPAPGACGEGWLQAMAKTPPATSMVAALALPAGPPARPRPMFGRSRMVRFTRR